MNWMNLLKKICRNLNSSGVRYCLLRMPTEPLEDVCPGDVDLLVDRRDLNMLYDRLAESFCLGRLSFIQTHAQIPVVDRESGLSLKLDLHAKLYVGMSGGLYPYPIEEKVLDNSIVQDGIPRTAFEYEYTLLMLHTLTDKPTIREARLNHLFALFSDALTKQVEILGLWKSALGVELADLLWVALASEDIDALKVLRRSVLRHFWSRSPLISTRHIFSSQIRARSYLWNWPLIKPFTVAIVGPDGVGKSTLGKAVAEHPRVSYRYFGNQGTFLPTTKLIHKVWRSNQGQQITLPKAPEITTKNKQVTKVMGPTRSSLVRDKLKDLSSRPLLQWHHAVEMTARYLSEVTDSSHDLIIFDRYVYDMCIDNAQNTSKPPWKRVLTKFYSDYFPAPDLLVLLVADPELIYERKPERRPAELRAYILAYRELIGYLKLNAQVAVIEELQTDESKAATVERLWITIERARLSRIASVY